MNKQAHLRRSAYKIEVKNAKTAKPGGQTGCFTDRIELSGRINPTAQVDTSNAFRADTEDPANAVISTIGNIHRLGGTKPDTYRAWRSKVRVALSMLNKDVC